MMEHATPLLRPDGSFEGYAHHCMDVHERTALSEELAARTHALRLTVRQHGRFEAALAREFATLPADRARARLVAMARLSDGASVLDRTRFRLADWIAAATEPLRLSARDRPPALSIELPAEPVDLDADRPLLTQALAEVLADAAAAQHGPRVIELRAARTESRVMLDTPGHEDSSAFALLACAVQLHGGEVLTLPDDAGMRLCLPFAKRR
jgi:signal transduction histidine kinase